MGDKRKILREKKKRKKKRKIRECVRKGTEGMMMIMICYHVELSSKRQSSKVDGDVLKTQI